MASRPFDLLSAARDFADRLNRVLNGTVCDGVRLTAVVNKYPVVDRDSVMVGYGLSGSDQTGGAFRLGIRGRSPIHCLVSYQLRPDDEGRYLTVASSVLGLFLDETANETLLHFDYERDKGDGYPEAHLQVCATSQAWEKAISSCRSRSDRRRTLEKLHIPVGGRRLRPTLEDLVEFVISERLVQARPGWKAVLDQERHAYAIHQMRAMIRRYPEAAAEAVREFAPS